MTSFPKILIVEDDPAMQATLCHALEKEDYQLFPTSGFKEGEKVFEEVDPEIVLLDLNLPDGNGKDLLELLKTQNEEVIFIILTAFPDLRGAISLMRDGAFDYLVKPFHLTELKLTIQRGLELRNLKDEVTQLKRKIQHDGQINIIGESASTRQLRETIINVAESSDSTVLITGESGTGKELVANAIHANSRRSNKPWFAINCSAIPENLVESELFGFEKGAFTNAYQTTKGIFELAHGGTLFLDEIGEIPLTVQPKLLRVLETRKIKRIGGRREISVDIRLLTATNKNLMEQVNQGFFREDLYYRINVIPVELNPLKERVEDIQPLLEFFSEQIAKETGMPPNIYSSGAVKLFEKYNWPGNAREFKNLVERMMIIHGEKLSVIEEHHLPEEVRNSANQNDSGSNTSFVLPLDEIEKSHISSAMQILNGNKSEVSRQLGISRNTLKEKLQKYNLT